MLKFKISLMAVTQYLKPYPLEEAGKKKIDELLASDVIEPVDCPSGWVSPLVVVKKTDNDMRICVDMRKANEAVG